MATSQRNYRRGEQKYEAPRRKNTALIIVLVMAGIAVLAVLGVFFGRSLWRKWELEKYPIYYPELVARYAGEYDLDPYEVMSVIHVESGGRAAVESSAGAIGLMQITPPTGEWIAGKFGETFEPDNLADPDLNIRYGCWYLRFLHDRFSVRGTVWAAYNRGHNKVAEWLEDPSLSGDGLSLVAEGIPAGETRDYVSKMQNSYDKYRELYPEGFAVAEEEGA